ncbi:MAG: hypothetical protein ACR2NT_15810 [Acidimicrobiia bacterium]
MTNSKTQLHRPEAERLQQSIDQIDSLNLAVERLKDLAARTKGGGSEVIRNAVIAMTADVESIRNYLADLKGGPRPPQEVDGRAESIPFRRTR